MTPDVRQERPTDAGYVCQSCGSIVVALVDDGPLCIGCDLLHFPPAGVALEGLPA